MRDCVVVFPGQGAQRAGMARDFHEAFPSAVAVFEEASEALGVDLRELCFHDDPRLKLTEFVQPAILTAEIAMLRSLEAEYGLRPTHFGGHSLGEYSALVAAGVLPLAQGVRLVRERGRRMQEAVPPGQGAMAAVMHRSLDLEAVARCLEGLVVDVANLNAPGQVVLSGKTEDVEVAVERLRGQSSLQGAQVRKLPVSAPFHSRLMAPVEPGFRALLLEMSMGWQVERAVQVVSNFTGGFHVGACEPLIDALTRQLSGQVRWVDNMRALAALAPPRVLEIGPTSPLRGLFQVLRVRVEAVTSVATLRQALAN